MASLGVSSRTVLVIACLFIPLLLQVAEGEGESFGLQTNHGMYRRLLTTIDCKASCTERCSKSSRPHLCMRACGTCCARCNCVPPGTSGNTETCPCYATMRTHDNKLKCP